MEDRIMIQDSSALRAFRKHSRPGLELQVVAQNQVQKDQNPALTKATIIGGVVLPLNRGDAA